jgi:glutamine amidotransferase
MLEPGELVHVDLDLRATSGVILDEPPGHILRLEDLDPRAAASKGEARPLRAGGADTARP